MSAIDTSLFDAHRTAAWETTRGHSMGRTVRVQIVRATRQDLDFIRSCTVDTYSKYVPVLGRQPTPVTRDYEAALDTHEIWIASSRRKKVAVLVTENLADCLLIYSVAVMSDAQGKGIGRALLTHAELHARFRGFSTVRLYTNERMESNVELYRHCGYVETEREVRPHGVVVHMAKELV